MYSTNNHSTRCLAMEQMHEAFFFATSSFNTAMFLLDTIIFLIRETISL